MASRATSAAASAASSAWTCAQSPPFAPPPEGPARRAPTPAGPRRSPRSPPRSARPAWRTPGSNPARRGPCPLPRLTAAGPRAAPGHRPGPQEPGAVPGMARLRASAVRLAAPPVVLADAAAPEVADRGQPGVQPGPAGLQLGQRRLGHRDLRIRLFDQQPDYAGTSRYSKHLHWCPTPSATSGVWDRDVGDWPVTWPGRGGLVVRTTPDRFRLLVCGRTAVARFLPSGRWLSGSAG